MLAKSVIQSARSLLYDQALVKLDGEFVGALAAIPKYPQSEDLNYSEIFMRDNVPVMVYLLIEGKYAIVQHFLNTCLRLQSNHFQTRGIFPTSFVEKEGQLIVDYGQRAIGRVCSVDSSLWWPILAYIYVQRSGDLEWARNADTQIGVQRFLNLILHPNFRDSPTLFVPDGAFMIDRALDVWGSPIEIQTLLYGALKSSAGLIQMDLTAKCFFNSTSGSESSASHDPFTEQQIYQFQYAIAWAGRLQNYLLKHYWITSKIVQKLRRQPTEEYGERVTNEYNIQTETIPLWLQDWLGDRGGYLIGNVRTGRPDFRFFTLGNCLGAIFDLVSPAQQKSIFHLMWRNRQHLFAQMPLRICHPSLDNEDWRKKTGYDRKNIPWCYHNGGHWPCLLWFFTIGVFRHNQHGHQSSVDWLEIQMLLQESYNLMLNRLPQQKWAEYFDGETGVWIGQQSRLQQTWTIVGFLLVHHFLKVNPQDAHIMDLPTLKDLKSAINLLSSVEREKFQKQT